MSQSEDKNEHSISVLKPDDLLCIFRYLSYEDLLQCRLVCPYWYQLIRGDSRLIHTFHTKLTLNSGTVVAADESPFSIILKSKIKINCITIEEDFLDPGNSIGTVETNRSRLYSLSTILKDLMAPESVTEMTVCARDNEPRTNVLLFEFIMEMKNIKVLRFTLPAFVHSLETAVFPVQKCLEYVQILHTDFKRLIDADFERLLRIFPSIKRIDVKSSEAMLLGENILRKFAPLIKSVEKLESYTLIELADIRDISLTHISYDGYADDADDNILLQVFLTDHDEIETISLKLLDCSSHFFVQEFAKIEDMNLVFRKSSIEHASSLCNIIKWTPKLKRLTAKFKRGIQHHFGHRVIEMKDLIYATIIGFCLDCIDCCDTMLKSIIHVKSLRITPLSYLLSEQLTVIATKLKQLECLELIYEDSIDLLNHFEDWPAMPKLKQLVVNRVGHVTHKGIRNLQTKCPMLEVIKLYSLRGPRLDNLLKWIIECFPNIKTITLRGGRTLEISDLNYIQGKVGWRLKQLDVSPYIKAATVLKLFKNNDLLEVVRCKYGALVVTRRIYYEVEILKAYNLTSIEQPLKNRKRLHVDYDTSSDSGTSDSEESSSGSSTELDTEDDESDNV